MRKYKTILLDPPWWEKGGGKIKRGADRHYPLLKPYEIIETIYKSGVFNPDKNCHLYLWVTNNHLIDGLKLIETLGFKYKTNLVWVKDRFGLGQYFRGQHELCLFAIKGKQPTKTKNTSTVIISRRREHSKKPDEIHKIIEKNSPPPYLEMFARKKRRGRDTWGNEL